LIDNLPYYTKDITSIKNAYSNNLLEFIKNEELVNKKTGEIYYCHKRKYLNLTFVFLLDNNLNHTKLTVRGSIHKLFNVGVHNANNFNFNDFKTTLNKFSKDFSIDLSKCILLPPEYGLNQFLNEFSNYDAKEIVFNTICEQRKTFQENPQGVKTSLISGSLKSEVRIKVYVKSVDQTEYCENTLRIELQEKKMRGLNKLGIIYVSDLLVLKNQIHLLERYVDYVKKLVIFDYTMKVSTRNKQYLQFIKLNNLTYWRKLIKDCKEGKEYYTKYNDEVKLLNELSNKHGTNLLSNLVQQSEKQYFKNLDLCSFLTYKRIKKPKNARVRKTKNASLYKTCMPCNLTDGLIINKYSKLFNNEKKVCSITGLDISMQREDSFLLSHTGLKYLYNYNRKLFEEVKQRHLYKKYKNADHQIQIKEIAHCIRDKRRRQLIKYPPHQTHFYELTELNIYNRLV